MLSKHKEKLFKEVCNFLNTTERMMAFCFSGAELNTIVHDWEKDDIIKVHHAGYKLLRRKEATE